MKVGDLVKIYDYSHEARRRIRASHERNPGTRAQPSLQRIDGHYVGLVVATSDNDPKHRRVLRCVDGEWEDYNVNRLEVIA